MPDELVPQPKPPGPRELDTARKRILIEGVELDCAPRDLGWNKEQNPSWWPQPDEPDLWYYRFERFYLMQGPTRSVQSSYRLWILSEGRELGSKALKDVSNTWLERTRAYNWQARAMDYDGEINRRILLKVEAASRRLRDAAPLAVEALINSLGVPRYAVQAAKEILDRAGLPAVTRQEIRTQIAFSTEDLEEAREEVESWEKKMLEGNG